MAVINPTMNIAEHRPLFIRLFSGTAGLFLLCSLAASCTVITRQQPTVAPKTQLQTRQIQTRDYDTNNIKLVMKAVLNVLQDEGFIVKNAQLELGLLTATKEIDLRSASQSQAGNLPASSGDSGDFWSSFFRSLDRNRAASGIRDQQSFNKIKMVEASVNISEFGRSQTRVRPNFQVKILDNNGNTSEVYQVDDPKYYQDFFAKVDKGIFIQKQGF
jgi:hypothetical protein